MKSAMAAQRIPIASRLQSGLAIFRSYRSGAFGDARSALAFHRELCDIATAYLHRPVKGSRVLDLGCGQTATQTVLFQADGADVVGVDVEIPTYSMGLGTLVRVAKTNGIERAAKSLLRHRLFDGRFFRELLAPYGGKLSFDRLDVRIMDATELSFADDSFDFVFSAWVFEHIADVAAAVREVNRVLRSSGVAWINAHLFPSLSGGHNLAWHHPDDSPSHKVPPWDHLRDNRFPANAYLNKLRLADYRRIFAEGVDVIDEALTFQGIGLLTPAIEAELAAKGYTREDLTAATVRFLCKKRREPARR
ncbi:MAG: class I SAM-dependent methyltransferase [Dehalococcoidia bacterium]|jgi:SAM-dependent methyltransferase